MIRRFYQDIKLDGNEIMIRQKGDVEIKWHPDQSVIQSVKSGVHRYHAKQKDGILYATQLDDSISSKYTDGQAADVGDVSMGDTLVYIPKFYNTLMYECGDTSVFRFSKEPVNDDSFEMGDVFIGAYGGTFADNKINSISNTSETTGTNKTLEQLKVYAQAKGNGYSLVALEDHNLVGLLYVALYHNTDCKGTLGTGANTESRPCGQSTPYGMRDSAPGDSYTCFLGIENWWGGRYELVGNVVANKGSIDGVYHVTERDGSTRTIQTIAPESKWLYPRKMILGKRFDIVADPVCYQGEITAGHGWFSEQYMRNESDRVLVRGGFQADISSGFAFLAARFNNAESGQHNTMTSRLAYKGAYEFVSTNSYREKFDPNYVPPVVAEEYGVDDAPDGVYVYTDDSRLMNLTAYEQSGKTLDNVYGIAVLDRDYRYCIDPRITSRLKMNVSQSVVVPILNAYGQDDTNIGLYTCWYITYFASWKHDKAPSIWFALNSTSKYGEQGYLPSYGEACSMQKNSIDIANAIEGVGMDIPNAFYQTSTFTNSGSPSYVYVTLGRFGATNMSIWDKYLNTECTSLPIFPLMEYNRDYFVIYQKNSQIENSDMSMKFSKHGIIDYIFRNSHRYLCKYINGIMNVCQLDDNNSNYFHDGTPSDLSGNQGDVMMMMPKFYTRIRNIANSYTNVFGYIQTDPQSEMQEYGGGLIGVYQSSMVDGSLRSVSGRSVLSGVSKNQLDAYVKQRGNGFSLLRHQDCDIIALLFMLKYEHTDWETLIGHGAYSENSVTGATNDIGMSDGSTADGRINIFGLEDFWGNGYEYIGDARYGDKNDWSSKIAYCIDDDKRVSDSFFDTRDFPKNKLTFSEVVNLRNAKSIDYVKYNTFCMYPTSAYLSDSPSGIGCQFMFSDQWDRAVARGGCNDGLGNGYGLMYLNTMFGVDEAGDDKNRSRISYNGEINVVENVQEFLSL